MLLPILKSFFRFAIFQKYCSKIHFLNSCVPKKLYNFHLIVKFSEKLFKTKQQVQFWAPASIKVSLFSAQSALPQN